jgi:hypothetical protein
VLELREELSQAEIELKRLKKQWSHKEAHKKRSAARRIEPLKEMVSQRETGIPPGSEDSITRRSVEIDRRKALLQGQLSQQSTPGSGRRRVLRGGHTRTLSLLSPARPRADSSLFDEQSDSEQSSLSRTSTNATTNDNDNDSAITPLTPSTVSKRASWAPRSVHQATVTTGMKQLAEDMKLGLWTFVEDLRQATVGEEPITGIGADPRAVVAGQRNSPGHRRKASNYKYEAEEQETIRASGAPSRPRASAAFDDTPTPSSRFTDVLTQSSKDEESQDGDKLAAKALVRTDSISSRKSSRRQTSKRFSWAPLTVDSYEDGEWSNWDSPTVRSSRWSGSTANGDVMPTIPPTVPKGNESNASSGTSPRKSPLGVASRNPRKDQMGDGTKSPTSPNKLEELLPGMLNRLTPGNLKRTAEDLMKEWEKSLSPPATEQPAQPAEVTTTGHP